MHVGPQQKLIPVNLLTADYPARFLNRCSLIIQPHCKL